MNHVSLFIGCFDYLLVCWAVWYTMEPRRGERWFYFWISILGPFVMVLAWVYAGFEYLVDKRGCL